MINVYAFLVLLFLSVALTLAIRLALYASLRTMLGRTLYVEGAAEFLARAFSIIVLLAGLGPAIGMNPSLKPDAQFIEGVWAVANGLGNVMQSILVAVGAYLILITVLLAALKSGNISGK